MAVSSKSTEQNGIVAGGARGGAIRAASGYAFSNIQFWAAKSAERFSQGKPIKPYKQSKTIRFLDSLFLGVLKANPEQNEHFYSNGRPVKRGCVCSIPQPEGKGNRYPKDNHEYAKINFYQAINQSSSCKE